MAAQPGSHRIFWPTHCAPPITVSPRHIHEQTNQGVDAFCAQVVTALDPQPLHQRRGHPLPVGAVSVGAPSPWANPRQPAEPATSWARAAVTCDYAAWIAARPDLLAAARSQLAGHDLACWCPPGPCHRDVLIDIANPPDNPLDTGTNLMGLALRRPWASLLLVPGHLGGKNVENKTYATDYRGPVAIFATSRVDDAGTRAAQRAGLDTDWHIAQAGWLGATVLIDVHSARGRCCAPWGYPARDTNAARYHWVFAHPARLALPNHGHGFSGLRPVSWSALVRRGALGFSDPRKELNP
ncbi:DUF4326 domain-containing protein [Mycobacterium sp. MFM001]|uniref:DUF4326 domain-containing protein n=1 Tax=Mycobacterium sp. MFM001 TaxID=2049453 RepID=UPI0018652F89|nr:DUF4326 domain-containing protein [Mycobacterium sp. MFM001]